MNRTAVFVRVAITLVLVSGIGESLQAQPFQKLGPLAKRKSQLHQGWSRVIVRAAEGESSDSLVPIISQANGRVRRRLALLNAQVVDLQNAMIADIAASPLVGQVSLDRRVRGAMERTGATVAATAVRQELGYQGSGVGVAVIDSGVTSWHDDLSLTAGGGQRVYHFVDFVNGLATPYDDYGHGTHVAGIVAGNGFDSDGARTGIAPAAHLVVLKVLDGSGNGHISDVIAALDYVVANKDALNIRVVNLSVAAGVYESYDSDPLTLAAKRVAEAGVVVVAAAGNRGHTSSGVDAYGGITAPGNAPWVLTVGASSHMGTVDRADDTMAEFSSRGPTALDYTAKPDLVAPGVGIESLSNPESAFYTTKSAYLLSGTMPTSYLPYLSLSGTSMAAPVVSGTVALMLEANPSLTPNQVKAILQYTAQLDMRYDPLTVGAGFLNAKGAVELARFFVEHSSDTYTPPADWSAQLIWGNQLETGGLLTSGANAWHTDVVWGAGTTPDGQNIEWGVSCSASVCDEMGGTWVAWSADGNSHNVVWGSSCSGDDCQGPWTIEAASDDDSVVWGTNDDDSVVWGTSDDDSVVWGTSDDEDDSVVWGTSCNDPACEPVLW
jgi:serine protease AprX